MIVNRTPSAASPAKMTLYFKTDAPKPPDAPAVRIQPGSSGIGESTAQPPAWDERIVQIDMKHKHSDDILAAFMHETKAEPVMPTAEDEEALRKFEKLDELAAKDRARMKKILDEERKAKAMLRRAKAGALA